MEIKISNEDDLVEEFKKVDIQYTKFFTVKQNGNNIQTSCGLCVESLKNDEKEYKERCVLNPDLPIEIFEETYRKSMNNSSKKKHLYNHHRAACIVKIQMKLIGKSGTVTGKKLRNQNIGNFISQISTSKTSAADKFRDPTSLEKRERDVETALRCIKIQSVKSACDDQTITLAYRVVFFKFRPFCQRVVFGS